MTPIKVILSVIALFVGATHAYAGSARVIDGDTIAIGDVTYRINGIDAPEHGQTCGTWACGKDATKMMAELVEGKSVACRVLSTDGYGRSIADCEVDGQSLGATMVEQGFAWAFVKYSGKYVTEEAQARKSKVGIWSGAFQPPWEFRAAKWEVAEQTAPAGCPIKGNISKNGRIYHAPWSPWYSWTKISESQGERWFCSEDEAVAAGWRAPAWR